MVYSAIFMSGFLIHKSCLLIFTYGRLAIKFIEPTSYLPNREKNPHSIYLWLECDFTRRQKNTDSILAK